MILRWNGKAWTRVTSPSANAMLNGLGFASAKYGRAVGDTNPYTGSSQTYILHWNGSALYERELTAGSRDTVGEQAGDVHDRGDLARRPRPRAGSPASAA